MTVCEQTKHDRRDGVFIACGDTCTIEGWRGLPGDEVWEK